MEAIRNAGGSKSLKKVVDWDELNIYKFILLSILIILLWYDLVKRFFEFKFLTASIAHHMIRWEGVPCESLFFNIG